MAFIGDLTAQRAYQLGFDWWELRLSNWACTFSGAPDPYRYQYPVLPEEYLPPLSGIAIAPSSTVSKAIIWYNNGDTNPVEVNKPAPHDGRLDFLGPSQVVVTHKRPWLANLNTSNGEVYFGGANVSLTDPQLRRITVIAHPDTYTRQTYVKNGDATALPFGLNLNVGLEDPVFIAPELHLTLFFRRQPLVASFREPFYHIGNIGEGTSTERLARVFPIYGRKSYRLSLSPTWRFGSPNTASSFAIRVTAVKQGKGYFYNPSVDWQTLSPSTEVELTSTALSATPNGTVEQTTITGCRLAYDYLLVYMTDSLDGGASLQYQFMADDE